MLHLRIEIININSNNRNNNNNNPNSQKIKELFQRAKETNLIVNYCLCINILKNKRNKESQIKI